MTGIFLFLECDKEARLDQAPANISETISHNLEDKTNGIAELNHLPSMNQTNNNNAMLSTPQNDMHKPFYSNNNPSTHYQRDERSFGSNYAIKQEPGIDTPGPLPSARFTTSQSFDESSMSEYSNPHMSAIPHNPPIFRRSCSHEESRPPQYLPPVKEEPGSNFAAPSHQPTFHNEPHPLHRQMSVPATSRGDIGQNCQRRGSEPVIHSYQLPGNRPQHYHQSGPTRPHGVPPNFSHDLYYVNLASYHHHQHMETLKRQEMARGDTPSH